MKIVCISDTHCRLRKVKVPEGDLLIHAGDLTFKGSVIEISQELKELGRIAKNFKHGCVLICGNHDWLGEKVPSLMKDMCGSHGITYLDHSSVQIEGLNIFGSAYTPTFCDWAFNVDRGNKIKEKWDQIPIDTNILITHGPPMKTLDSVMRYDNKSCEFSAEHLGCYDLTSKIETLAPLKLHVFGHIHEGYGQVKTGQITYVNASICTEEYKPTNPPIVVEI